MPIATTISSFVSSLGLSLNEDGHCRSDQDFHQNLDAYIAPLSHYSVLAVDGPDAEKFLQGQTTCDFNTVNDQTSSYGAYCTPKGRAVSSFLASNPSAEHYCLRLHHSILDSTRTALSKYIVFSKAELLDQSNQRIVLGLQGEQARRNIAAYFGECPQQRMASFHSKGESVIQLDDEQRFECWLNPENLTSAWPILCQELAVVGSEHWQWENIHAGIADISELTADLFIPQMLNYHNTGAISFKKGCYTGQEVVARMHYKGKLKRQLYRVNIAAAALKPGDTLFSGDDSQTQGQGNLVNVVQTSADNCEALAVISLQAAEQMLVAGDKRAAVTIEGSPYAITTDETG